MPKDKNSPSELSGGWAKLQERVLMALEKDTVPWRQTWNGMMPMNYVSKKPYRGVNVLMLGGGETPYWLTWKQTQKLGGRVLESENKLYSFAFWYKRVTYIDKETEEVKSYPSFRAYLLYNLAQTTLPIPTADEYNNEILMDAEDLMGKYEDGPKILIGGGDPSYSPSSDTVKVPMIGDFHSSKEYYAALFHELVHSTGHHSRLDRFKHGYFGSAAYSEEELVAEIGACYMRAMCGLDPDNADIDENSASYIKGWHSRLASDPAIIKRAVISSAAAVKRIAGDLYYEGQ